MRLLSTQNSFEGGLSLSKCTAALARLWPLQTFSRRMLKLATQIKWQVHVARGAVDFKLSWQVQGQFWKMRKKGEAASKKSQRSVTAEQERRSFAHPLQCMMLLGDWLSGTADIIRYLLQASARVVSDHSQQSNLWIWCFCTVQTYYHCCLTCVLSVKWTMRDKQFVQKNIITLLARWRWIFSKTFLHTFHLNRQLHVLFSICTNWVMNCDTVYCAIDSWPHFIRFVCFFFFHRMGHVWTRHSLHETAFQLSRSVDRAGLLAKMASIEFWISMIGLCALILIMLAVICSFLFILADGKWVGWTSWTSCSASCGGGGQRLRSNICLHFTGKGSQICNGSTIYPAIETKTCNLQPCPNTGKPLAISCRIKSTRSWPNTPTTFVYKTC